MIRTAPIAFTIAVACFGVAAQTIWLPDDKRAMAGIIRSVRQEGYSCTSDPSEKPWRVYEATFDRKGNVTRSISHNADGSVAHEVNTTYDAGGHMTGWTSYDGKTGELSNGVRRSAIFKLSNGKPVEVTVYKGDVPERKATMTYDTRGNKIKEVGAWLPNGQTETWTYKYDDKSRLMERRHTDEGRDFREVIGYDASGNIISSINYEDGRPDSSVTRRFAGSKLLEEIWSGNAFFGGRAMVNAYDTARNIVMTTIEDASITSKTTYEYYDNGKLRVKDEVTTAKPGGRPQGSEDSPNPGRRLEKYDRNGRQVERYIYAADGSLHLTQLSIWDDLGRQIRLIETSRDRKYDRDIVYEYDSHNQLIKQSCRKTTANGEIQLFPAEKRIITYY